MTGWDKAGRNGALDGRASLDSHHLPEDISTRRYSEAAVRYFYVRLSQRAITHLNPP